MSAMIDSLLAAAPHLAGQREQVEALVRARWEEARAAWPELAVPLEGFVAAATAAFDDRSTLATLRELHAADLYLAQACALGDARAIAAFEAGYRELIEGSLRPLRLTSDVIADVTQDIRQKLFVADAIPKIATYSGRAALATWTRTVATRTALARMRRRSEAPADDYIMKALPALADGPEEEHFRVQYGIELKAAFEEAMASLSYEQRNVLRHYYIDALNIDEIGALYDVHRSTAARWLEAARTVLGQRTQETFRARAGLTPSEMQSVVRILESNVELSLRRLLAK